MDILTNLQEYGVIGAAFTIVLIYINIMENKDGRRA